jgi:hypothetical protein
MTSYAENPNETNGHVALVREMKEDRVNADRLAMFFELFPLTRTSVDPG